MQASVEEPTVISMGTRQFGPEPGTTLMFTVWDEGTMSIALRLDDTKEVVFEAELNVLDWQELGRILSNILVDKT